MYAMKIEDLKGRGKVRTYSGLFSMGALAIALSACGGDFKLADKSAVALDGNKVTLTFTAAPKSADSTKIKVDGVALAKDKATVSGSTVVIDLGKTGNAIKVTFDAGGLKDSADKDYTTALTIDNKAPSATAATVSGKVATITFDEKITAADATKFANVAGGAVVSAKVATDGLTVDVTFTNAPTIGVVLAPGAVTDDAASQSNTEGIQNKAETENFGAADTSPPVLADADPIVVDKAKKTITLTFDETIASIDDTKFTVMYDAGGTSGGAAELQLGAAASTNGYTAAVVSGKVVLTVTVTPAVNDLFKIAIAQDGVTDTDGNKGVVTEQSYTVTSLEDDLVGLSLGSSDADYGF